MLYAKNSRSESAISEIEGVVVFCSQRTVSGVMKLIPGSVVQIAADVQDCINKCKQLGNFTELGVMPLTQNEKGKRKAELHNLRSETDSRKPPKKKIRTNRHDLKQIETCANEPQQTPVLLTVSREVVPPLPLPEVPYVPVSNWLTYAYWILDVLKIPFFNITSVNSKKLTLNVPGRELQYYFFFHSTWLKSSSGNIYFNYKLSTSAMNGCGLDRIQPNEYIKDTHTVMFIQFQQM